MQRSNEGVKERFELAIIIFNSVLIVYRAVCLRPSVRACVLARVCVYLVCILLYDHIRPDFFQCGQVSYLR